MHGSLRSKSYRCEMDCTLSRLQLISCCYSKIFNLVCSLEGFVTSLYGGAVLRSGDETPSSYMNFNCFFFPPFILQAVLLLPTHLNSVP